MEIERKNTSKGLVLRYIFEDMNEYNEWMKSLEDICNNEIRENKKEDLNKLIGLFKDYFEENNKYTSKPTVTVFENHILTVAALLWVVMELSISWMNKYIELQKVCYGTT